ncbi:hypothetical protein [Sediminimonas sp.]|uniref:hypothetical protein n=1 Tax=Sediminimonas sp. TaxID=2823379 RepID=UPI0025DD5AD7|nr:hypothetical protein [Sediminimonas sp.]
MTLALTFEDQDALKAWAAPRCDLHAAWPESAEAIGVIDSDTGKIRAVMIMVQTYSTTCDLHFASDGSRGWATRNILGGLFGYVFLVRKVPQAHAIVGADNIACQAMNIKLGFEIEARLRGVMDDNEDGILFTMHRDRCAWIKEN